MQDLWPTTHRETLPRLHHKTPRKSPFKHPQRNSMRRHHEINVVTGESINNNPWNNY